MSKEYYIAGDGNDDNPGTFEQPFKTISGAQARIRESQSLTKEPITVCLRQGTYYLAETVQFIAADSGGPDTPIIYTSYADEDVILSGSRLLELDWEPYRDGIFQARTPAGLEIDQLFVNAECQHMARYPSFNPDIRPYGGFSADAFSPERARRWKNPVGGYIHAMQRALWGGFHYRITGKNDDGTVSHEGGWQNNRQLGMHDEYRFVENIFEELDAPGEWFHDQASQTLFYYPPNDIDISSATVEVVQLKHLIEFNGTPKNPVRHIQLKGLTFRHAARTIMEPYEQLLRSDWSIYRGGAVMFSGAEDCEVSDCEFDRVGGNGVFVSSYNRRIAIRGTHIHGAGGSAVCFVGSSDSVRSPLFERHEHQSYHDLDKAPGPKTDNYPADCIVDDCLIHDIGVIEKQATGVQISMSRGITIRHCSIYDVGRAGINISEGTFGGHLIEFCDVFDTVLETDDHGSFNSWGRDRYWELEEELPSETLKELMLLDADKTIIRNSRWRCDHGWDVDLDDGSSNYEIYNNLFLRGGLKLREGFLRKVYNNMAINSTLHPHVWYPDSGDVVTNNLWMARYRPVGIKYWDGEIDHNMFVSESDQLSYAEHGWDINGIVEDPGFKNPANGDYSLDESSPFLKHGFENIPMDRFGVQKPSLKAIARVPEFPQPILDAEPSQDDGNGLEEWAGCRVTSLKEEEFSAFGARREDGGVHLVSVPDDSLAAKGGFKEGDLVQRINGAPVKTVKDLRQCTVNFPKQGFKARIIRKCKGQHIEIKSVSCSTS